MNVPGNRQTRSLKRLSRDAGQGTLEYLLVMIVTVMIILSLIYQFNDAFRSYAQQFFDGYLACLLETGELPGRGGDCSADFKKFNIADGKPAIGGAGGGSDGGGGNGTNGSGANGTGSGGNGGGDDGKNGSAANGGGGKGGSGGGDGGGSESVSAGGGGNSTPVGSIAGRMKGRSKSTAAGSAKKGEGGGEEAGKESLVGALPGINGVTGGSESGRSKKMAMDRGYGYWGQEEAEKAAAEKPPVSQVSPKNEADGLKSKVTKVDATRKTASVASDDDGGFSFGYLLRIILITGLVLAIVVFMGGQLMQIAKSSEK